MGPWRFTQSLFPISRAVESAEVARQAAMWHFALWHLMHVWGILRWRTRGWKAVLYCTPPVGRPLRLRLDKITKKQIRPTIVDTCIGIQHRQ